MPEITVVHNLDENGNPVQQNESLGSGEVVWHNDNSYAEKPPAGSMLYGRNAASIGREHLLQQPVHGL